MADDLERSGHSIEGEGPSPDFVATLRERIVAEETVSVELAEGRDPAVTVVLRPEPEERIMRTKRWMLVGFAAAIALIAGVVVLDRDSDEGGIDTFDQPEESIPPEDLPAPEDTTTTTVPDVEDPVTTTVRPASLASWTEYVEVVEPWQAQNCALFALWGSLPSTIDINAQLVNVDILDGQLDQPIMRDSDSALAWIDIARPFAHARLNVFEGHWPEMADVYSRFLVALDDAEANAQLATEVDLGPAMVEWSDPLDGSSVSACGTYAGPLAGPLQEYGSDAPQFGVGKPALQRCVAAAALRSMLTEYETGQLDVLPAIDATMRFMEALFTDRPIDANLAEIIEGWRTADDPSAAAVVAELDAYRASEPDGALCPLDQGWEA